MSLDLCECTKRYSFLEFDFFIVINLNSFLFRWHSMGSIICSLSMVVQVQSFWCGDVFEVFFFVDGAGRWSKIHHLYFLLSVLFVLLLDQSVAHGV